MYRVQCQYSYIVPRSTRMYLNEVVGHKRGDVGCFGEELERPRGVSLPQQLHASLQIGLSLDPSLLLLPALRW